VETERENEQPGDVYRIDKWGGGFFKINGKGNLAVSIPREGDEQSEIDILEVVQEARSRGVSMPVVIRFHDILRAQIKKLNEQFATTIGEAGYSGKYIGIYPVKVNQMREVVEEVIDAGYEYNHGLEAGSKAELIAILAMNENPEALTIVNGYKDSEQLDMVLLGATIGRKIIIVIEKISEIDLLINKIVGNNYEGPLPMIGLRIKMLTVNPGKWKSSSGERAKFGLTVPEILRAIDLLDKAGLKDRVKLIHFHIGSQISDIRAVKESVAEGARIYSKLSLKGVPLEYLDIGGGLAIDYDGSHTNRYSSKNYTLTEYVSDIVYGIQQVCDLEHVAHPNIITETGRGVVSRHSCVITDVLGEITTGYTGFEMNSQAGAEHILLKNMRDILKECRSDNIQESYNDAVDVKDNALTAFKLGVISLEERASVEALYWNILNKIKELLNGLETVPEGLINLDGDLSSQYLCNFSVFQSTADCWAIDQLLPVVPITRLNEEPTVSATLADITCDSDGKIDKFIGNSGLNNTLKLHKLNGDDYYIGIFLTGAYQDVMGDNHNLFGRVSEVHVFVDNFEKGGFFIEEYIPGATAGDVLSTMQYSQDRLSGMIKNQMEKMVKNGEIRYKQGTEILNTYRTALSKMTYLKLS